METHANGSEPGEHDSIALVVIGSSAGGIDALLTVVSSLPADFPAPIVVAQHIDPNRESRLAEVLAARTAMRVQVVGGAEVLRAGTVYVVPADRDVEISDHHVGVLRHTEGRSKPSVDRLMASAARVFTDKLIGVVLSGSGMDGTIGAQAIKAYGGTVIIQNPATAAYSGMPSSVAPSTVDVVSEVEAIGPLLVDLLHGHFTLPAPEADSSLSAFLGRIRDQTGINFATYKQPTVQRRLKRRMAVVGAKTLAEYRRFVDRHPEELQHLVSTFLIKVTRFFRDPELFNYLHEQVLPRLVREGRERGELRIWSAGCATGEEAYSLAMLVAETLGDDLGTINVRIFATDIAHDAIEFARRGAYPLSATEDVPPDLLERYFVQHEGTMEVNQVVRSMVVFGEHDLSHRAPFPRIDLVLCRNVLIYFTSELQRRTLQLFAFSLRPGGYLVLGKAESVGPLPDLFTLEASRLKVYRRIGAVAPVPLERFPSVSPAALPARPITAHGSGSRLAATPQAAAGLPQPARQALRIIDSIAAGIVSVDRKYDIRFINRAARNLLGIRSSGLGDDLIHGIDPSLGGSLRAAIDSAFLGQTVRLVQHLPWDVIEDRELDLAITCSPAADEAGGPISLVNVEVVDVTEQVSHQRDLERERAQLEAEVEALRERAETATAEVRQLRQANEVLAGEQWRLRIEVEQLQIAQEEAQAATEEIETLNEEMQATNEELETLNEELQATVEELNATNDELEARAMDLQTLASSLEAQRAESEAQRARLEAILSNMRDAFLVVDERGTIVQSNTAWERLIGTAAEMKPEDEEGRPLPEVDWPQRRIARGEAFTMTFVLTDADGTRHWFEASGQPVQGDEEARWGVVVIRDITDRSLRRLQNQFMAIAAHELRTPLTALSGTLQLLTRRLVRLDVDDRLRDLAARSLQQTRRLEGHVSDLMDMARLQGGQLRLDRREVDLLDFVRSAVETAQPLTTGQEIVLDIPPDEPAMIAGDVRRLEQVILNLLTNAITYAPETARIDVRLRRTDREAIVEVEDYGAGIAPEELPHIFERFYRSGGERSARDGLGLGLYISREIVTAHGGTIDATSTLGVGTRFEVRLPLIVTTEPSAP